MRCLLRVSIRLHSKPHLALGGVKNVSLNLTISNAGDDAYDTNIYFNFSREVFYINFWQKVCASSCSWSACCLFTRVSPKFISDIFGGLVWKLLAEQSSVTDVIHKDEIYADDVCQLPSSSSLSTGMYILFCLKRLIKCPRCSLNSEACRRKTDLREDTSSQTWAAQAALQMKG